MTDSVRKILAHYAHVNPGVRTNLARLLNHGALAGTGRLVILPVDQGFEHGPARSFGMNPAAYDPGYHFQLALEAGCSAYAAPLGFIEGGVAAHAGEIPLILKVNSNNSLHDEADPISVQTASVADALRLGCVGIGYTIYPGSAQSGRMFEQLRQLTEDAKTAGLCVVVWSYPRGSQLSKDGETAIDVVAYAAHIAAQLGADVIKVKLPSAHLEQAAARKVYEAETIKVETLAERVRHVVQATFAGQRIVVFSGGGKVSDDTLIEQVRAIRDGGGNGSIIGRNSFQRPRAEAVKLLRRIIEVYKA
ncbi:MAG TPA: class I fructose-bisphosphate aldolase [Candidatus Polarisedimenticolaceae bacterium]|nr:class I fructose-bisphosphate aldolase [Candidatus Polarisedimenticolaceae bacterium]